MINYPWRLFLIAVAVSLSLSLSSSAGQKTRTQERRRSSPSPSSSRLSGLSGHSCLAPTDNDDDVGEKQPCSGRGTVASDLVVFSSALRPRDPFLFSFHRPLPIRTVDDNGRKARYNHFRSAPKLERRETHSTKLFPFSISFYPPTPLSPSVLWTTDLMERDEGGEERRFLLLFLSLSLLQCLLLPSFQA